MTAPTAFPALCSQIEDVPGPGEYYEPARELDRPSTCAAAALDGIGSRFLKGPRFSDFAERHAAFYPDSGTYSAAASWGKKSVRADGGTAAFAQPWHRYRDHHVSTWTDAPGPGSEYRAPLDNPLAMATRAASPTTMLSMHDEKLLKQRGLHRSSYGTTPAQSPVAARRQSPQPESKSDAPTAVVDSQSSFVELKPSFVDGNALVQVQSLKAWPSAATSAPGSSSETAPAAGAGAAAVKLSPAAGTMPDRVRAHRPATTWASFRSELPRSVPSAGQGIGSSAPGMYDVPSTFDSASVQRPAGHAGMRSESDRPSLAATDEGVPPPGSYDLPGVGDVKVTGKLECAFLPTKQGRFDYSLPRACNAGPDPGHYGPGGIAFPSMTQTRTFNAGLRRQVAQAEARRLSADAARRGFSTRVSLTAVRPVTGNVRTAQPKKRVHVLGPTLRPGTQLHAEEHRKYAAGSTGMLSTWNGFETSAMESRSIPGTHHGSFGTSAASSHPAFDRPSLVSALGGAHRPPSPTNYHVNTTELFASLSGHASSVFDMGPGLMSPILARTHSSLGRTTLRSQGQSLRPSVISLTETHVDAAPMANPDVLAVAKGWAPAECGPDDGFQMSLTHTQSQVSPAPSSFSLGSPARATGARRSPRNTHSMPHAPSTLQLLQPVSELLTAGQPGVLVHREDHAPAYQPAGSTVSLATASIASGPGRLSITDMPVERSVVRPDSVHGMFIATPGKAPPRLASPLMRHLTATPHLLENAADDHPSALPQRTQAPGPAYYNVQPKWGKRPTTTNANQRWV